MSHADHGGDESGDSCPMIMTVNIFLPVIWVNWNKIFSSVPCRKLRIDFIQKFQSYNTRRIHFSIFCYLCRCNCLRRIKILEREITQWLCKPTTDYMLKFQRRCTTEENYKVKMDIKRTSNNFFYKTKISDNFWSTSCI